VLQIIQFLIMNKVIIVAYDISNDRTRNKFSKFLQQFGVRIQFSVYEIQSSNRLLNIVRTAIKANFEKMFEPGDSIYVFTTNHKNTERYGSAGLIDKDLIFI
jgi:CRISPR-associated protein Cas2